MNRFYLFLYIGLVSIFLAPLTSRAQAKQRPNIVIIYTDDQGYGDVSALNKDAKFVTPNIDKLADQGIIFTDGHSSDAVCSPSRYTLLTGRYSWRTSLKKGVLRADGPCLIEKGRMTIASLLKENGYNTGMVGKWHLQMDFVGEPKKNNRDWSKPFVEGPIEYGFDYFFGIPASMNFGILTYLENDKVLDPPILWTKKKKNNNPRTYVGVGPADYRMTPPYLEEMPKKGGIEVAPSFNDELVLETFAGKAVDYINERAEESKAGKPFFLYLALTSPHLPHCTHKDFQGRTACGNYGDFIEETDHRVGQVLEALEDNKLTENTLVIFSSDNGAETNYTYHQTTYQHFSNLHFKGGKRDIYEGGHRVPFLMRWPNGIDAGLQSDFPVCQSDFLATIADIIDRPLDDHEAEDSFSLFPLLKNHEEDYTKERVVIHHSASGHFAIRQGKWKLNMFRGSGGSLKPAFVTLKEGDPKFELYDLEKDPSETTNLYFEYPEVVEELTLKMTSSIENGRTTKGQPQPYIKENWEQINWTKIN
ncbi:sulfatase family protein [Flammeovirga aprica]|uniref:Arylsulfatase n=1 Tax=Flammeovirga aprica JL-4 TaxID=694437 RepID=A0A7X9RU77_9BACT|nr:arylsulfatase [Flammeovirga aprica]NME68793.1 arylsulfatase [Flammeovirga aprica JL-4]